MIPPLIVTGVTLVLFAVFGIFPFGTQTISWCDMDQQTVPLLMDFKDILEGKSSIFYSTGNAGGMNFWGVFLFFLASPLYLTVRFVAKENIIYLVNVLLVIKLALSALTAQIFFKRLHSGLTDSMSVLLSVMYAGCGYGLMYCQTLVWLDIMALFPILLLGMHRLFSDGKPMLYFVTLCCTVAINFYLSFMTVIYIILWSAAYIFICCPKQDRRRRAGMFIFWSFIAMLITAPVWLCAFLQVMSSARGSGTFDDIINRSFAERIKEKVGLLMFTASAFAVIPFFIKSKLTKIPQIKHNIIMLILLMIPVFADPINKFWHTGSYQCFALRYGYITVFTLLILTAQFFENNAFEREKICLHTMSVPLLFSAVCLAVCIFTAFTKKNILSGFINSINIESAHFKLISGLFLLCAAMVAISITLCKKKLMGRVGLMTVMSAVFIGQYVTGFVSFIGYAANDGSVFTDAAVLIYDNEGEPYYRTKTEKKYIHVNMIGGLGYDSFAHYTSLTQQDLMFAMKKLGYSSYWMEIGANGGTALTDSILGIKYSIGAYFDLASYYEAENLDGDLERGSSDICLPLGLISDKTPDEFSDIPEMSRIDIQRLMAKRWFGDDSMIQEYRPKEAYNGSFDKKEGKYSIVPEKLADGICQLRYTIPVEGKQVLYFDLFDRLSRDLYENYFGAADVYVNGSLIANNYPKNKNNGILTLGEFSDTTVEVLVIINKPIEVRSFGVFGVDVTKLRRHCSKLRRHCCELYADGRNVTAQCRSESDGYIYMSVPYDKGLKAFVNGEEADIIKVNDCFCALKLKEGDNDIRLTFMPYGMGTAVIMTAAGIIILIIRRLFAMRNAVRNKLKEEQTALGTLSLMAVAAAAIAVILAVYTLPMAIWLLSIVV